MGEGVDARVLHVGDDRGYGQLLASRIEHQLGFEVVAVTNPADAVERLAAEEFDCVVSDYDVSGVDGLDFLDRVRERHPDVPFVLLTGEGDEAVACEAISAGVTDYFEKGGGEQFRRLANRVETVVEKYRAERALAEQRRRHEEFVRLASHDLRNPLAVARGWLELLYEEGGRTHYEKTVSAIERMEDILDNLETLERTDEVETDEQRVELSAVATAAWEVVDAQDADLHVEYGPELRCNPSMLQQALENLVENAVVHGSRTPRPVAPEDAAQHRSAGNRSSTHDAGGRPDDGVTVRIGVRGDGNGFFVEDDGRGIPEEAREQIFESGYSGDGGTGLGLAIVRRIAEVHGWEVRATEGDDGGARFEFTGVDVTSIESRA